MTALNSENLSELERVALGVLGAGLVPSAVAGDPRFRLDVLTAASLALLRGLARETYLDSDIAATPAFQRELSGAYYDLDAKHILGVGGPSPGVLLSPGSDPVRDLDRRTLTNFDQHPAVFDRYLAGRCLDEILKHGEVYRFIMGKYAESSEVWQRVYKQYT